MSFKHRCLIVDALHPSMVSLLEAGGVEVIYEPDITPPQVLATIDVYTGIVVRSKLQLDAAFFAKAENLLWVGRSGAGMDNIDAEAAAARGVELFNAPEGNRDAVAEHALGLLLSLLNHIPQADAQVRKGIWNREQNRGTELGTKTVGLWGFGNTGRATAHRLRSFGCRVLAYDKYLPPWAIAGAIPASAEQIWAEADILSLHIPLTAETLGMIDSTFFSNFKKNIWLINTARGKVVRQADLLQALAAGKVLGAALDVLENENFDSLRPIENIEYKALFSYPNVILTPHVAGWTNESYVRLNEVLAQKILNFIMEKSK